MNTAVSLQMDPLNVESENFSECTITTTWLSCSNYTVCTWVVSCCQTSTQQEINLSLRSSEMILNPSVQRLVLVILKKQAISLSTQHLGISVRLLHNSLESIGQGRTGELGRTFLGSLSPLYSTQWRITWFLKNRYENKHQNLDIHLTTFSLKSVIYALEDNKLYLINVLERDVEKRGQLSLS